MLAMGYGRYHTLISSPRDSKFLLTIIKQKSVKSMSLCCKIQRAILLKIVFNSFLVAADIASFKSQTHVPEYFYLSYK